MWTKAIIIKLFQTKVLPKKAVFDIMNLIIERSEYLCLKII